MRRRRQRVRVEEPRRHQEHDAGDGVRREDHRATPDGVEEVPEQQWPEEVAEREGQEVDRGPGLVDVVEVRQDQRVGEEDRVVEEALRHHHRQAQDGAASVAVDEDVPEHLRPHPLLRLDDDGLAVVDLGELTAFAAHPLLDLVDGLLGLFGVAVGEQPARALRDVPPQVDDREAEDRADEEREAPADVLGDVVGVEQVEVGEGAEEGAEPVRAVDGDVDAAAVVRRDELVDGRVDRGVLAADAHAGDEPAHPEEPHVRREAGQARADEVDDERQDEQLAPPEPVGQAPERQRADDLSDEVDGAGQAHLRRRHPQRLLEPRLGHDLDLEAVEDPGDPEPDDHRPVELRPGQPVQPGRDQTAHRLRAACRYGLTHHVSLARGWISRG